MRKQEGRKEEFEKREDTVHDTTGERRSRTLTYSLSSGSFQTIKPLKLHSKLYI